MLGSGLPENCNCIIVILSRASFSEMRQPNVGASGWSGLNEDDRVWQYNQKIKSTVFFTCWTVKQYVTSLLFFMFWEQQPILSLYVDKWSYKKFMVCIVIVKRHGRVSFISIYFEKNPKILKLIRQNYTVLYHWKMSSSTVATEERLWPHGSYEQIYCKSIL